MLSVRASIISPKFVVRFLLLAVLPLHASVVGTNTPAKSLTVERVMALPAAQRAPWLAYIKNSEAQMAADKAALAKEREGLATIPPLPKQGFSGRAIPLHRGPEFYKSDEAKRTGDIILSFQTPGGGWSKNLAMDEPRQRGQLYATANLAPVSSAKGDFDEPKDEKWHYISTLDNDATNTELHFLAELSAALPGHDGDKYRASALCGYEYLLRSQFPNGGWPQVWPLEGGYHDAITYNDDAVTESAETLANVAAGQRVTSEPDADEVAGAKAMAERTGRPLIAPQPTVEDYTFVPAAMRAQAKAAVAKALQIILKTQLRVPAPGGKGTVLAVWAQQNDSLTLEPVSARNYEMPALSSGESASVLEYLISIDHPSPAVVTAINAAAAWFEAHKVMGYAWTGGRGDPGGRTFKAVPGAGPLWSRYYSLTTQKPIFGDRDKTIHDDVMEISLERRNGYSWWGAGPEKALKQYAEWKKVHP
jgi:Pectic acid lyase